MSRLFQAASAAAVVLTTATAILTGVPGFAQDLPGDVIFEPVAPVPAVEAASTLPKPDANNGSAAAAVESDTATDASEADARRDRAASLRAAVAAAQGESASDAEHRCLAAGIYYESQGEPLEGQLAVAHVILNRAQSGRFASTVCGVLTQRSQFSFVRNGVIPTPPQNANWRTAQAVAQVALDNSWRNPTPGAMYFHAARVSPRWNRARIARLGNHIFYR
jgi:spore germination cell wall hydrolase CwlJ-like protein